MGYYVRAFCTAGEVPTVGAVIAWVAQQGVALRLGDGAVPPAERSAEWDEVSLVYAAGRDPILCSVARDDGTPKCLFREEVREFGEFLEDADESPARERVLRHLAESQYVVTNQLAGDIDDAGYRASAAVLDYFVRHAGGLVQADGEGFYAGDELIVPLD